MKTDMFILDIGYISEANMVNQWKNYIIYLSLTLTSRERNLAKVSDETSRLESCVNVLSLWPWRSKWSLLC